MTPTSHPSAARISEYASGRLPAAPSIVVAAHVEACAECAQRVAEREEREADLMQALEPAHISDAVLKRLLARIDAEGQPPPATAGPPRVKVADIELPAAAARAGLGRRRMLGPRLWAAPVKASREGGWDIFLLHIPADFRIPTHGHQGDELLTVLKGAFRDGETYRIGDFAENPDGSSHGVRATHDGACACLISIQGRIRWRGWARLLTPTLGI